MKPPNQIVVRQLIQRFSISRRATQTPRFHLNLLQKSLESSKIVNIFSARYHYHLKSTKECPFVTQQGQKQVGVIKDNLSKNLYNFIEQRMTQVSKNRNKIKVKIMKPCREKDILNMTSQYFKLIHDHFHEGINPVSRRGFLVEDIALIPLEKVKEAGVVIARREEGDLEVLKRIQTILVHIEKKI